MNLGKSFVKSANRIDEDIENQILRGRDMDFMRLTRFPKKLGQMLGTLKKGERMGKEKLTFRGQRLMAANTAALLIKLDTQSLLQRQQAIANTLLGDVQDAGRPPQASLTGQLDESRYLIR